jgi:RND family efflux transporter MFP subunit
MLVQEGEILALMDNRVAQAAVHSAQVTADRQAPVQRAKNDLEMAERYLQRVTEAAEAASEVELDKARGNVEQAHVALSDALEQARMAESHLELERARLATHELRAPFDGCILDLEGSKGQSMTRTEPILTMANLKTLHVELHVPVAWYSRLKLGQAYELLAADPVGQVLQGTLVASQPVVDPGTRTFRCTFEIDNATEQWPAGFVVRLVRPRENDISTATTNTKMLGSTLPRADRPAAARDSR